MDEILKELERFREEGYEYNLTVFYHSVDAVIFKKDVLLKEFYDQETLSDVLKATLRYIYKIHRTPHRKRVKL